MEPRRFQSKSARTAGATLPEMLVGSAVASLVLGALMVGSIVLQRSYAASDQLCRAQADLIRVTDFMSKDIRNATAISTTVTAPVLLSLTTSNYYDPRGTPANPRDDVAYDPVLGRNSVTYGTGPVTIRDLP